ncbi:MAG: chromate transporter [Ruminiclostridium sp.]
MKEIKKPNWSLAIKLFWVFFKISPITFGGGFAMVPIIEREVVDKKKWMDNEQMANTLAAAQSVPGAVAVNSAIFIGYNIGGVVGALAAMLGAIIPTFIIIVIIGLLYDKIRENHLVRSGIKGIQGAVIALVIVAAYKMGSTSLIDKICWGIFVVATAILIIFTHINIIFIILSGASIGILVSLFKTKLIKEK